jgi:hypothetical protein
MAAEGADSMAHIHKIDGLANDGESSPRARFGSARPTGELFDSSSKFGSARDVASNRSYNPAGVILTRERMAELSEFLMSLENDYQRVLAFVREQCNAEIERRVASENYEQFSTDGPARLSGKPGYIGHMRKDPVLGRIGVQFHPREVPDVAQAFDDLDVFLSEAEHALKAWFY